MKTQNVIELIAARHFPSLADRKDVIREAFGETLADGRDVSEVEMFDVLNSDRCDFIEVSVSSLKAALEEAVKVGIDYAMETEARRKAR